MKASSLTLLILAVALRAADTPDPVMPPPPPSVALNHPALANSAPIRFVVDEIPPTAKYIVYGQINLQGLALTSENAGEVGGHLSEAFDQITAMAREKGADLVVLLGQKNGVPVTVRQCASPLVLKPQDPVVTAILFQSADPASEKPFNHAIHFSNQPAPQHGAKIAYDIKLAANTAGITKSFWFYGNISRFVADAEKYQMDTIYIGSSDDHDSESVWLPHCDSPAKISNTKPVLTVVIYKS